MIPETLIFQAGEFGFYYLGSPYTDLNPEVMDRRADEVWRQSGLLTKYGVPHYSPIYAKHAIAKVFNLPKDVTFWWAENVPFLYHACGMIVAEMPRWQESKGLKQEIEWMRHKGMPVYLTQDANMGGLHFIKI